MGTRAQEEATLSERTYRLLKEHAELLRQIGLPHHAADIEKLAEEHLKVVLGMLETTQVD